MSVIVGTVTAIGSVAVLMTLATFSSDTANVERRKSEAEYLSLGAIEAARHDLLEAVANWEVPAPTGEVQVGDEVVQYTIVETGLDAIEVDAAGIQTLVKGYELTAIGESWGARAPVHRILNVEATPIFQFAVFYDNDLEIFPGPSMELSGRVHTNGDLFIGSNNTLTLNSNYLRAAGQMFRYRKDAPNQTPGTVHIRRWVENSFDPDVPAEYFPMYSQGQMASMGVETPSGYDSQFTSGLDLNGDGDFYDDGEWLPWGPGALEYWSDPSTDDGLPPPDELPFPYPGSGHAPDGGGAMNGGHTVLDHAHSVGEAHVPGIQSIAMFRDLEGGDYVLNGTTGLYEEVPAGTGTHAKGFFHENAGLTIITYDDGTWDAWDDQGFSVKPLIAGSVVVKDIYDARQAEGSGQYTRVTELDMEQLSNSGAFPANGLVYASHYGLGQGTDASGVKLTNGAELAGPLTVVSEGAVYVQGDYNVVDKKPAAVIGDAVNLLSNAWDDSKHPGTLPTASDTTFNVALITGNHETVGNAYNGGFENLPRFHEKWSGKDCRINGAFVNTWYSKLATGEWVYGGDRYTAPNRLWSYDPMFNSVANLPPFTPLVVSSEDIVTW